MKKVYHVIEALPGHCGGGGIKKVAAGIASRKEADRICKRLARETSNLHYIDFNFASDLAKEGHLL